MSQLVISMWSKRLKSIVRVVTFTPVAAIWNLGFKVISWIRPGPQISQLQKDSQPRNVCVIVAHPDDETIGAGGVIALHAMLGDQIKVIVATNGGASRALDLSKEAMVEKRGSELKDAVSTLGNAELLHLGLDEFVFDEMELVARLQKELDGIDLVYTHSNIDFHPDHIKVASAVAKSLAKNCLIRIIEIQIALAWQLTNRVIDISKVVALKGEALQKHKSQEGTIRIMKRLDRYRRSRYGKGRGVEVFWEMTAAEFRSLLSVDFLTQETFYGMRSRPWTDPFVWMKGRSVRRRLLLKSQGEQGA